MPRGGVMIFTLMDMARFQESHGISAGDISPLSDTDYWQPPIAEGTPGGFCQAESQLKGSDRVQVRLVDYSLHALFGCHPCETPIFV